jgi:hypothetical protein
MAHITLCQFEQIDGLLSSLLRMGPFETCADPRGYIRTSNRLFDACADAMGFAWTDGFSCAEEAAASIVAIGLTDRSFVVDVEGLSA